ncbi:unnamed protein product [Cochlearia groenlandica]
MPSAWTERSEIGHVISLIKRIGINNVISLIGQPRIIHVIRFRCAVSKEPCRQDLGKTRVDACRPSCSAHDNIPGYMLTNGQASDAYMRSS